MRVTRALYDEVVRQREVLERRCEGHDGLVALLRARIDDLERTLHLLQHGRFPPIRAPLRRHRKPRSGWERLCAWWHS